MKQSRLSHLAYLHFALVRTLTKYFSTVSDSAIAMKENQARPHASKAHKEGMKISLSRRPSPDALTPIFKLG